MTGHHTQRREPSGRRWLRVLCATGALGLLATFAFRGTAQEDSSSTSRFFRLPGLFRGESEEAAPAAAPQDGRLLRRVRQLMSDAQLLETSGHPSAALNMARRAESVLATATRTAGVNWPASERTPADYVAILEQKVRATGPATPQPRATQAQTPAATSSPAQPQNPQSPASPRAGGFLLNWGDRAGIPVPAQPTPSGALEATSDIQVVTGGDANAQPQSPARSQVASQPEDSLLNRLRSLDTWGTIGDADLSRPRPASPASQSNGMPAIGGWQREFSDGQVGPIPTRPPGAMFENLKPDMTKPTPPARLSVEGPSRPTEIPPAEVVPSTDPFAEPDAAVADDSQPSDVVAEPVESEPAGPQPVETEESVPVQPPIPVASETAEPVSIASSTSEADPTKSASTDSPLLLNAAVQVLATFVGVLLAILVFRAVAIRVWGPGMGLVVPVAQQEAVADEGDDVDSDVLPFKSGDAEESQSEMEIPDPASVPFRLVGSSYEDERLAEEQAEKERDEAILKTVFEQNVDLMDELHDMRKSA